MENMIVKIGLKLRFFVVILNMVKISTLLFNILNSKWYLIYAVGDRYCKFWAKGKTISFVSSGKGDVVKWGEQILPVSATNASMKLKFARSNHIGVYL